MSLRKPDKFPVSYTHLDVYKRQQYHQFQKLAKRQKLLYSSIHDRDGHGKIIDVILPVTELDRANQIFERMLYQESSRHPERQGPQEAEKAAPKRPVQEERQEGAQSRQAVSYTHLDVYKRQEIIEYGI